MGMTFTWDNEDHTMLRIAFEGKWTLDEFYTTFPKAIATASEALHPYVTILDFRNGSNPPRKFLSIGGYAQRHTPDNQVQLIILGGNFLIRNLFNILHRSIPKATPNLAFVDTMDEAYDIAAQTLIGVTG